MDFQASTKGVQNIACNFVDHFSNNITTAVSWNTQVTDFCGPDTLAYAQCILKAVCMSTSAIICEKVRPKPCSDGADPNGSRDATGRDARHKKSHFPKVMWKPCKILDLCNFVKEPPCTGCLLSQESEIPVIHWLSLVLPLSLAILTRFFSNPRHPKRNVPIKNLIEFVYHWQCTIYANMTGTWPTTSRDLRLPVYNNCHFPHSSPIDTL